MKIILTIAISLSIYTLFGQDTTYFNTNWEEVNSLGQARYYEILKYDKADTNKVVLERYYKSGQIKTETYFYPYCDKIMHGKRKEWYETGQLRMDIDYKNGKLHGQVLTYWDGGQIKRKDKYEEGKLIEGNVWNQEGKEVKYYNFLIMPEFRGGLNKMIQYLSKKVKYPRESRKKGTEGTVLVSFIVEKDGRVSNVKVIKSVIDVIDNEAIRVVKNFPKWKSGMEDGERIRVQYNLPINFKLTN